MTSIKGVQDQVNALGKSVNQIGGGVGGGSQFKEMATNVDQASTSVNNLNGSMTRAGLLLASLGAAIAKIGIDTANVGATWETAGAKLQGLAQVSPAELKFLQTGVLGMKDVTDTPTQLLQALYPVESVGIKGQDALDVVHSAAKAHSAGLGPTSVITDVDTSILKDYNLAASETARINDMMVAAVTAGKIDPAALAKALPKVVPLAAANKISIDEVLANLATASAEGVNPDIGATALNSLILTFDKGSKQSTKALAAIGMTPASVRREFEELGMQKTLADIMSRTHGNIDILSQIFPNKKAILDFLTTAVNQGPAYAQVHQDVLQSSGRVDDANAIAAQTTAYKFEQMQKAIEGAQIALDKLDAGPINAVLDIMTRLADAFANLDPSIQRVVVVGAAVTGVVASLAGGAILLAPGLEAIGALLAGPVATGLGGAVAAAAPVILILAALAAGAYLVVTHWDSVKTAIGDVLNFIGDHARIIFPIILLMLGPISLVGIGVIALRNQIAEHWEAIVEMTGQLVRTVITLLGQLASTVGRIFGELFGTLGNAINTVAPGAGDAIKNFATSVTTGVSDALGTLNGLLGGASDTFGKFAKSAATDLKASTAGDDIQAWYKAQWDKINSLGKASPVQTANRHSGMERVGLKDFGDSSSSGGGGIPDMAQATDDTNYWSDSVRGADANVNRLKDSLDAANEKLNETRDQMNNVKDAEVGATKATKALTEAMNAPLVGENAMDQAMIGVDNRITAIELKREQKQYARITKTPARSEIQELGRLMLLKDILAKQHQLSFDSVHKLVQIAARQDEATVAQEMAAAHASKQQKAAEGAASADTAKVKALNVSLHQQEAAIKTLQQQIKAAEEQKKLAEIYAKIMKEAEKDMGTSVRQGDNVPMNRQFQIDKAAASAYPSVGSTTNNTTQTTTVNAPMTINVASGSASDAKLIGQIVIDTFNSALSGNSGGGIAPASNTSPEGSPGTYD